MVESTTSAKTTVAGRRPRTGSCGRGITIAVPLGLGPGGFELPIVREHPPLQFAQLCARLQAELLVEQRSRLAVDLERLRLPAGGVEAAHQLRAQPLAKRVLGHERAQLGHDLALAAAGEVRFDAVLEHLQARLLESLGLAAKRLRGQAAQGGAAPKGERFAQQ